ncbi:MAG: efflux RND transporter periplasmic adaptor subunit [Deltaproteobacteria bacterium]|nr:efflux RND transporter periplasmic adaptor subunit [Deltaproteobacteria bacterium]MDQ3300688.1 efflux RND transporter periplasmic adaptor subunit [Myxococcota bacterium]
MYWKTVATVALALLAALSACKQKEDGGSTKAPPPAPIKLEVITVGEAPVPQQMVLTGIIKADQRSEVTADTAGKVVGVMVDRGQRVKMGQELVRLDVRTQALSAREAQANLATARAQRQLAEEECKRAQSLLDKGAITRSEYDRQTTQCTSALQQVSAAEARTAMIAKSVADGIVRAPFEGVIGEKNVTPGDWVAPGRPLFTLIDDDPLRIELSVPEAAVRAIKPDQRVELTAVADPEKTYGATITRLGAEIGRTRSLMVEATLDKGAELVPGMFAEAKVTIGQVIRPVLPASAVVKRGKTWHAFVVVNGEAQDRIVQLGTPPAPGQVSIVQGVAKGDKVVAKITEQVVDGVRVAL